MFIILDNYHTCSMISYHAAHKCGYYHTSNGRNVSLLFLPHPSILVSYPNVPLHVTLVISLTDTSVYLNFGLCHVRTRGSN